MKKIYLLRSNEITEYNENNKNDKMVEIKLRLEELEDGATNKKKGAYKLMNGLLQNMEKYECAVVVNSIDRNVLLVEIIEIKELTIVAKIIEKKVREDFDCKDTLFRTPRIIADVSSNFELQDMFKNVGIEEYSEKKLQTNKKIEVLSLNVNTFSGVENYMQKKSQDLYENYKEWISDTSINFEENIDQLLIYIREKNCEFVILYEYLVNNWIDEKFREKMDGIGYGNFYYAIKEKKQTIYSCTVVFWKENNNEIKEIKEINFLDSVNDKHLRTVAMNIKYENVDDELILYGIHAPLNDVEDFWSEVDEFCKEYADKQMLLIGDFNLFKNNTIQKNAYLNILKKYNLSDVWLYHYNANERATYAGGARLDYAVVSSKLKESSDLKIDDTLRVKNATDHSALICEVNLKNYN